MKDAIFKKIFSYIQHYKSNDSKSTFTVRQLFLSIHLVSVCGSPALFPFRPPHALSRVPPRAYLSAGGHFYW